MLLDQNVSTWSKEKGVSDIQSFTLHSIMDNCYQVCHVCRTCIRGRSDKGYKFGVVPLYSYANGCWVGKVPQPLQGLTYLEEVCIARARATSCMFKLNAGPTGQRAARGNVCVFQQENYMPLPVLKSIPPHVVNIADEVAVVIVSPSQTVTFDNMSKTPLLVRRSKIRDALLWLKTYNPLYSDIIIDDNALQEYPEHGPVPVPCLQTLATETVNAEGSS
jgi:hypothetical protein